MKRIVAAIGLLALAACQPLPQPFQHSEPLPPELVALKDTYGVRIEPTEGLPDTMAATLDQAMVKAFEDEDVPAAVSGGNQRSFVLRGKGQMSSRSGTGSDLTVVWEVSDPSGKKLGHTEQRMPLAGSVLTPDLAFTITHLAVGQLTPFVADAPVEAKKSDAIVVWSIDGAPGDGKTSLKRAVEYVLRENKIPVAEAKEGNASLLLATIEAGKPKDGKQDFSIRWVLMRPDGSEVGAVEQHNAIPAGSLDSIWGDTAILIAEAAYDGIAALLESEQRRQE